MPNNDVYLGNPLLKKANTTHEFTEDQVLEIVKCMNDPVYFANNYVKIVKDLFVNNQLVKMVFYN